MLDGVAPILIFNFKKLTASTTETLSKIPLVSKISSSISLPPIPLYLSTELTGIVVDEEEKSIEIETKMDGKTDGSTPDQNQKPINSTTKINLKAQKNSIGLMLLSALSDKIVPLVTSQEYSITYLNGPITVFDGTLHSLNIIPIPGTDLLQISIELNTGTGKTEEKSTVPQVSPELEAVSLESGITPTAPLVPPMSGPVPRPPAPPPVPIRRG